ncbi:Uncharacterized protein YP598_2763 [Yersinia pseudotuberculosis]|uniref:Uncharacterized protein n=1 Tax=Yersinia pseudotuberculosis serotype O:1b (strain IP 31758) TaxID=349747 RepID=A0A0U1QWR6_YERP3|nr:hypothetical protein YpsIP31758_2701 [Yersinia pseudotuberculosis IP 31758]UFA62379.1 Uncharacterized protein YP598_2763 [Yersinia pseudotuberculosis]
MVDPLHEYYQYWTYQFYFLSYGFTLQADNFCVYNFILCL